MSHWNVERKPLLNSFRIHAIHRAIVSVTLFITAIMKNDLELHSQVLLFLLVLVIKVRALCVAQIDTITESYLWPHLKIITNGMCDFNVLRGIWEPHICKVLDF